MMSGGVDSSVAAALLVKRGFNVVGVFMKNWDAEEECPWIEDARDARRVAAKIGIPFYVMNLEKEYRKYVFDPFVEGIRQGMTPNPDVFCNTVIKFGVFLEKALLLGADMVATGHYAKVKITINYKLKTKNFHLWVAKDEKKDQTYFLYRLNQFQLSKALFPVGKYLKSEVRALAKELGLATFNKPDSQGICFVGQAPFEKFMSNYIAQNPGAILDNKGRQVGTHKGVAFYTLGQRRGLGVGGAGEPFYVAKKDMRTNTLTVVREHDPLLYEKIARVTNVHWISGKVPKGNEFNVKARFRHQQKLQGARITKHELETMNKLILVYFLKPQRALTPGQSIVFYKDKEVLGGGILG